MQSAAQEEVDAILRTLPAPLRERARGIPVVFQPHPAQEILDEGFEEDILGLFVGHDHAAVNDDPLPPEILLFLWNIWDFSGRRSEDFREEVRRTFLHELGHYLGLDEDGLYERDLD
ncbi:MAG: metallopeptidase family protein [Verrucomicrobia bacterium]|nr:metallopeptidase family protein [Verrucomicrobiota bacterium]